MSSRKWTVHLVAITHVPYTCSAYDSVGAVPKRKAHIKATKQALNP